MSQAYQTELLSHTKEIQHLHNEVGTKSTNHPNPVLSQPQNLMSTRPISSHAPLQLHQKESSSYSWNLFDLFFGSKPIKAASDEIFRV
jgi:hypothetical protein